MQFIYFKIIIYFESSLVATTSLTVLATISFWRYIIYYTIYPGSTQSQHWLLSNNTMPKTETNFLTENFIRIGLLKHPTYCISNCGNCYYGNINVLEPKHQRKPIMCLAPGPINRARKIRLYFTSGHNWPPGHSLFSYNSTRHHVKFMHNILENRITQIASVIIATLQFSHFWKEFNY